MVTHEFRTKALKVKLIATDIDGVWTDGGMYYSAKGEEMKLFSTYDGQAVALLREQGLEVAILTGENSLTVKARAEKLQIKHLFIGEQNKLTRIISLCESLGLNLDEVAYIGDDVNDLQILEAVGLSALACNSPLLGRIQTDFITSREGGKGAFRDFADHILEAKR